MGKKQIVKRWCGAGADSGYIQTIDHFITYSVITAAPQLTYSSVVSTIRLFPITSGPNEGHTFIQWSGNFSSDADAGKLILGQEGYTVY